MISFRVGWYTASIILSIIITSPAIQYQFFEIESFDNMTWYRLLIEQRIEIFRFMRDVNSVVYVSFVDNIGSYNATRPFILTTRRIRQKYEHTFVGLLLTTSDIDCKIAQRVSPMPNYGLVLFVNDIETLRVVFNLNCVVRSGFGGVVFVFPKNIHSYGFNELEMIMKEYWQRYGKKISRLGFIFNLDIWVYHPFVVRGTNLSNPENFGALQQIVDPDEYFERTLNDLHGFPVIVEQFPSVTSLEFTSDDSNRARFLGVDPEIERTLQKYANYTGIVSSSIGQLLV